MALDGWSTRVADAHRNRYVTTRAVRQFQNAAVGPAYRRWHEYAAMRTRHHRVLVAAATRFVNRLLRGVFDLWLQHTQRARQVVRILTRNSNMSLSRAMRQWHEFMQAEVYRQAVVHAYQSGVRASPLTASPKPQAGR
jgi:hypothetical protein